MSTDNLHQNTSPSSKHTTNSENLFGNNPNEGEELTINQWRSMLAQFTLALKGGEVSAATANAFANLMGKGLNSYKLQMEYAKMVGKTPNIPALQPDTKPSTHAKKLHS